MAFILIRSLAAAGLCLACLPAFAQEAGKPFRLQTAIGAPGWLEVSGHIRPRYETLANQFFAGRTGDDEYLGIQSLLKLEADTGAIVLGGEIQDTRRIVGNEGGGLWTTVTDVRVVGAIVKIEVTDADGRPIQVELGRERYQVIRAIIGESVYVKPRHVRVFMDE